MINNILFVVLWIMVIMIDARRHTDIVNRNQNPHLLMGMVIRLFVGSLIFWYVCFYNTWFVWYNILPFMISSGWILFVVFVENFTRNTYRKKNYGGVSKFKETPLLKLLTIFFSDAGVRFIAGLIAIVSAINFIAKGHLV